MLRQLFRRSMIGSKKHLFGSLRISSVRRWSSGLEPLEERRLLALDAAVAHDRLFEISSDLTTLWDEYTAYEQSGSTDAFVSDNSALTIVNGSVAIDAVASTDTRLLSSDLVHAGFTVAGSFGRMVSAMLPLGSIDVLASIDSLAFARPVYLTTAIGATTTQGDQSVNADAARTILGLDGTGVSVGILSDSYANLPGAGAGITSGDLPGPGNPNGHTTPVNIVQDFPVGVGNEVQQIAIQGSPTGGTFTLVFNDGGTLATTAGIPFNATAAQAQAALEALSNIAVGDVAVGGGPLPGTAIQVTFQGNLANANFQQMVADSSGLTGGVSPTVNISTPTNGNSKTDEGRAMLEIVHDVAPGANLLFATASTGQASFAANIAALQAAGANVIVDDVFYFEEPFFQDGVIAQSVDTAVANGSSYFSLANNHGRNSYESNFVFGQAFAAGAFANTTGPAFAGGRAHDFDPGPAVDTMQQFTLQNNQQIQVTLQWDQPFFSVSGAPGAGSNVDIYVLDAANNVVAGSTRANVGMDPSEFFSFTNTSGAAANFNIIIVQNGAAADDPGFIKYINITNGAAGMGNIEFDTNSGTAYGHANSATGNSVGAAAWFNTPAFGVVPPQIQNFSSAGGIAIRFDTNGNAITPVVRQTPNIVAPNGGNTTFFGSDIAQDADSFPNFFGTSAAAPHAGAVAALLLQFNPAATPAEIKSALENSAIDMDDPFTAGFDTGFDFGTGYGLINVFTALLQFTPGVTLDENGVLTICGDIDSVNQDDAFRLVRSTADNSLLEGYINNPGPTPTFVVPISLVQQINVFGAGGDDTLIVDSANGLINVQRGIRYDGDNPCTDQIGAGFGGFDTLRLNQTDGPTIMDDVLTIGATAGAGVSFVTDDTDRTQRIEFANLEPIIDGIPAPSLVINGGIVGTLLNADNAINYATSELFGVNWGKVTVDAFEPIHFTNKTSLTINGEAGSDVINLNNPNKPTGLTNITVNGQDPTASDTLIANGTTGVDAITFTPTGADSGSITGAGPVPIAFTTSEHVTINGQGGADTLTYQSPAGGSLLNFTPGATVNAGSVTGRKFSGNGGTVLVPMDYVNIDHSRAAAQVIFANAGGHVDDLVVFGSNGSDIFTVAANGGNGSVLIENGGGIPDALTHTIDTRGINRISLKSVAGDDTFNLTGVLPYARTVVDADATVNLAGATTAVSVNLGDNTPGSANPNTTITGYGGVVVLIGVDTANLDANAQTVAATGTSQNDNIVYTPTGAAAGTFYNSVGSGNNLVPNTVFNFANAAPATNFTVFGGAGNADQVTIRGTDARDLIQINQATAVAQVLANNVTALMPVILGLDVQILNAQGLGGQDTFQVIPGAGIGGQAQDKLLINLDGGANGENNALVVANTFGATPATLPATSFVVVNRGRIADTGTVRVFQAAVANPDINYKSVQVISPLVVGGSVTPNSVFIGPDNFEQNEQLGNAAFLGAGSTVQVQHASVFPSNTEFPGVPADQDFYRVVTQTTGTLDFQVYFRTFAPVLLPGGGQVNLELFDVDGTLIASAPGTFGAAPGTGNARIRIPAVEGQTYFLRVFGATDAVVNGYDITVINTPAPVPFDLELDDNLGFGDAAAGGTTTVFTSTPRAGTSGLSPIDGYYVGKEITFTSGALDGQTAIVTAYVAATGSFTVTPAFTGAPAAGDDFQVDAVDTGRSQLDNATRDNTPTIFLRLNDAFFLNDLPGNDVPDTPPAGVIPIPFRSGPSLNQPGYAIAVFDEGPGAVGATPPQTPLGFAFNVGDTNSDGVIGVGETFVLGVYKFTTPVLTDGSHFLTARVQIIDPSQVTGGGPPVAPGGGSGGVIVDGGDRDDHGYATPGPDTIPGTADDVNIDGWQYIQQMVNFANQGKLNAGTGILAIGADPGTQAGDAIQSVATVLGLPITFANDAAITTANFSTFAVMYVPSNIGNTTGGITDAELALLAARKADVQTFVNTGGSLVALTEQGSAAPYSWLELPDPFTIGSPANDTQQYQTPALTAAGLVISDLELENGTPLHNTFTGPAGFNGLVPFVLGPGPDGIEMTGDDDLITLGLAPGSIGIGVNVISGFGERSLSLEIVVDTVVPEVSFGSPTDPDDGLAPDSDSGLSPPNPETLIDRITNDTTPTFWGRAEADAIVRLYVDINGNATYDQNVDLFIGQATAIPLNGTNQEPHGYWEIQSIVNFNDPSIFPVLDGLRTVFVTAEDLAGNVNPGPAQVIQQLQIFIDTQGPQVTSVSITGVPTYDLFNPKGPEANLQGPTPLVNALTINFKDLPARDFPILYRALKDVESGDAIETLVTDHFQLIGDQVGRIAIKRVNIISNFPPADGQVATAEVQLEFFAPLPDDRFTLTITDDVRDIAGNRLDGETNAAEPQENPRFPSGDGVPGGSFVARFTVDSTPELGVYAGIRAYLDLNGNLVWDPEGQDNDTVNRDIVFRFGSTSDALFAGKFVQPGGRLAPPVVAGRFFDQVAAYGNILGTFRWLFDFNSDGVADLLTNQPPGFQINGVPVAGNFDGDPTNGDEVGLFDGVRWWRDTDHNYVINGLDAPPIVSLSAGYPQVGDIDGDGLDDFVTFQYDTYFVDFAADGLGAGFLATVPLTLDGGGLGFPGVSERPAVADMNQDGIDDLGIWVPGNLGQTPTEISEWYFLVSQAQVRTAEAIPQPTATHVPGTAVPLPPVPVEPTGLPPAYNSLWAFPSHTTLNNVPHYQPVPFGTSLFAVFGDEPAFPLVGNFDPPTGAGGSNTDDTTGTLDNNNIVVVAAGPGAEPRVHVYDRATGELKMDILAYNVAFTGGVQVATGDVNGDGIVDIITAPGAGGGPHIRVFDGATGNVLREFFAYSPSFTGGVFVATGDFNNDGKSDIVTGAGAGGGPHVRILSGADNQLLGQYFAYGPTFTGGVHVATGDINGDGTQDVVTGPGAGDDPRIKVFGGATSNVAMEFMAYAPSFTGGVWVTSGDVNGDGRSDIITGAGATGGPHVQVFSGVNHQPLWSFFAYAPSFTGGVRVATGDFDGDGRADILTGPGSGGGPHVRAFDGDTLANVANFFGFDGSFTGGVFVAAPSLGGGHALLAASHGSGGAAISQEELDVVVAAALSQWDAAASGRNLKNVRVQLADLPGDYLGLAYPDLVLIDADAAGNGWSVDGDAAAIDLLTAVEHELGHVLGLDDLDGSADELMAGELAVGVQHRLATAVIDDVFADLGAE